MISSLSFAVGLLALATASPLQERQAEVSLCWDDHMQADGGGGPAIPEFLDACIEMLRNDFGDQECSYGINAPDLPVFCSLDGAALIGVIVDDGRDEVTPTCSQIADAAQAVKDECRQPWGLGVIDGDWPWKAEVVVTAYA